MMSGVKRSPIEILQDQLEALSKKFQKAKNERAQLNNQIKDIQAQNQQNLEKLKQKFQDRAKAFEDGLQSVHSDVRQFALEFEQNLKNQHEAFIHSQQQLAAQQKEGFDNLKAWTSQQFKDQRREMHQIANAQKRQINQIRIKMDDLIIREDQRQQYASSFIEGLKKMIEKDEQLLPHEQFAPGKLQKVKERLNLAESNLNNQIPQAALVSAQETMFEYYAWKEEVVSAERQFESLFEQTFSTYEALLENVRKNRNVELSDDAGYLEVNYWTNGAYGDLESQIQNMIEKLEQEKQEIDQGQLEEIYEQIGDLESKQNKLIKDAIDRITSSQIRAEMGDKVVQSLEKQGFQYIDRGYEASDQRKTYVLKLRNPNGTEIVAIIAPDDEAHKNSITVNTYGDSFHGDAERKMRFEEIRKSLQDAGINLGDVESQEKALEEFRDVAKILEEGNSEEALKKARILNSQTRPNRSPQS